MSLTQTLCDYIDIQLKTVWFEIIYTLELQRSFFHFRMWLRIEHSSVQERIPEKISNCQTNGICVNIIGSRRNFVNVQNRSWITWQTGILFQKNYQVCVQNLFNRLALFHGVKFYKRLNKYQLRNFINIYFTLQSLSKHEKSVMNVHTS